MAWPPHLILTNLLCGSKKSSPVHIRESICPVCLKITVFSVLFFLLRRGLSPLRSSFLEMNKTVLRTSPMCLELACVDGMILGKAVHQGQSFRVHRAGGHRRIISSLSNDFEGKSWRTYELRRNVASFTSSCSDD